MIYYEKTTFFSNIDTGLYIFMANEYLFSKKPLIRITAHKCNLSCYFLKRD